MRMRCFEGMPLSDETGVKRLTPDDFVAAFGEQPSDYVAQRINAYDFRYRTLGPAERDYRLRQIIEMLYHRELPRSGEARLSQWETGWGVHIDQIDRNFDPASIIPGYFGKHEVVRWRQDLIAPLDRRFEHRSFSVIQDWLFDKYLRDAKTIYEFGCGTGHNLFRARAVNPHADLWGLDWAVASQKILAKLKQVGVDDKLHGHRFDFFAPDEDFKLAPGSVAYTVTSLEQTGERFQPFIEYLLKNRPSLCIHIEPIAELLDESNLVDFLSIAYFKRRNYLSGLLGYLRALEKDGRINIHMARRTMIGSLFVDGFSVVIWSPA
jgi:hypothetical protein